MTVKNENLRPNLILRKSEKHLTSPFMGEVKTKIKGKKRFNTIIGRDDLITNRSTGEVTGGIEHKTVHIVDDAEFVKVFEAGIAGIYKLTSAGKKVFSFLFSIVQENPNTDRLYLAFMDAQEEPFHISKPVFFRGMSDLIEKRFIAKSINPNMYFLNPLMIFNGNRFKFTQEYIREKMVKTSSVERDPKTLDWIDDENL